MHYAHLPAGYIASKLLFRKFEKSPVKFNRFVFFGMVGAITPDLDLLYYFLVDQKQHHHHGYFTHFPLLWLSFLFISIVWLQLDNNRHQSPALAFIFTCNGFLHMILDTIVGTISWLEPFVQVYPPTNLEKYMPWDSRYLELFVFLWALYLWKKPQIKGLFNRLHSSLDMIEK